jgi:hypothetical protein
VGRLTADSETRQTSLADSLRAGLPVISILPRSEKSNAFTASAKERGRTRLVAWWSLRKSRPAITLSTYSHVFARRDTAPLGEKLAAFMAKEAGGCVLVVPGDSDPSANTEVVDLMVARGGIEPPTRGFSIR